MIGLKRGTVTVVGHQGEWRAAFERERAGILTHASHLVLDIEHVGSTAVPGLDAKPIVDMAAAILSREILLLLSPLLVDIGWIDRGDKGAEGGHLFVKEAEPDVRTHHLHVVRSEDPQWRRYIFLRDLLRRNAQCRGKYAQLKRKLASRFADDRRAYTAAKNEFIASVLKGFPGD